MLLVRVFLGLLGLAWLGFGVWCFSDPDYLRDLAGVTYVSVTGRVDLVATYGGLLIAIAMCLLAGALNRHLTRAVLIFYGVICAGLGCARLAGAVLEAEWSSYTVIGIGFELGSVLFVLLLLHRARSVH